MIRTQDISRPAKVVEVNPFSSGGYTGQMIKYDLDGRVYEMARIDGADFAEERRRQARMPYNNTAEDFRWDLYHQPLEKQKKIVNSFVMAYADWSLQGRGLYICSETPGSGKTFLACCVANEIINRYSVVVKFVTSTDYIAMLRDRDEEAKAMREASLLIFDDIGAQGEGQEWIRDAIFRLIDWRYRTVLPTIYTSNLPIRGATKSDRTMSRIYETAIEVKLPEQSVREMLADRHWGEFLRGISA